LRASDSSELEYPVWKPHQHKGGFSRGFLLVVILAALLAVIYFNARSIGETVPQAATYVKVYVAKVDAARVWLAGLFNGTPPD
jgi:cell division protein FtsB